MLTGLLRRYQKPVELVFASMDAVDEYGKQRLVQEDPITVYATTLYADDAQKQQLGVGQLEEGEQLLLMRFPPHLTQVGLRDRMRTLVQEERAYVRLESTGPLWEIVRVTDPNVKFGNFVLTVIRRSGT